MQYTLESGICMFYTKKFTERSKYCGSGHEKLFTLLFPRLFFTHLDSRSHSSQPAKQSKNSTERWNKFFHFSAESYSNTSSKPCETGACALTQRLSPVTAGRAQACVGLFPSWQLLQLQPPGQGHYS